MSLYSAWRGRLQRGRCPG